MGQLDMFPSFDGATFNPALDHARLEKQLQRVREAMKDGRWRTLRCLALLCDAPEASVSARLRDLRKPKFGGHNIERKRGLGGTWNYRMAP